MDLEDKYKALRVLKTLLTLLYHKCSRVTCHKSKTGREDRTGKSIISCCRKDLKWQKLQRNHIYEMGISL